MGSASHSPLTLDCLVRSICLSLSFILQFVKMPVFQHPRSQIACFLESVFLNAGSSTVLPQLLESLDVDKVLAVQFLRRGVVFDGAPL